MNEWTVHTIHVVKLWLLSLRLFLIFVNVTAFFFSAGPPSSSSMTKRMMMNSLDVNRLTLTGPRCALYYTFPSAKIKRLAAVGPMSTGKESLHHRPVATNAGCQHVIHLYWTTVCKPRRFAACSLQAFVLTRTISGTSLKLIEFCTPSNCRYGFLCSSLFLPHDCRRRGRIILEVFGIIKQFPR